MLNNKTSILVLAIVLAIHCVNCQEEKPQPCNQSCSSFATCSKEGPRVNATDSETCKEYANSCELSVVNCDRENYCKPPLQQVESCDDVNSNCKYCDYDTYTKCSGTGTPVYAYDGEKCLTWPNYCQYNNEVCRRQRNCEKPLQQVENCDGVNSDCKYCDFDMRTKCSNTGTPVYAYDGYQCLFYANECQYNNEVCRRQRNCEKPLVRLSSFEECQNVCCKMTRPRIKASPICVVNNYKQELRLPSYWALDRLNCGRPDLYYVKDCSAELSSDSAYE